MSKKDVRSMDSKLVRFFDKIGLEEEKYKEFEEAVLENVVVDTTEETWTLYVKLEKMINIFKFFIVFLIIVMIFKSYTKKD